MKKLLLTTALLFSLNVFSQSFKDGNYKFTTDYYTDIVRGGRYTGINSVILQSSLNKITITTKAGVSSVYYINSKAGSPDEGTQGDMVYVTSFNGIEYNFIFSGNSIGAYYIEETSQSASVLYNVVSVNNY